MPLTSPGFALLLLPMAAALYYCLPGRIKPFGLLAVSVGFYLLMEPMYSPLVLFSLLSDCLICVGMARLSEHTRSLFAVALMKSLGLMGYFALYLPLSTGVAAPTGLAAICLTSLFALNEQRRGALPALSPLGLANAALFFGKLPLGPVLVETAMLEKDFVPSPSLSRLARGVMRFVLGLAKRVILAEHLTALLKTLSRLPLEQHTLVSAWLTVLCAAMVLYFTLSAYADIAIGLGQIFSLDLPQLVYYPFQASSLRDYLYRLNMPLERGIGRLFFGEFDREAPSRRAYLASAVSILVLALWLAPAQEPLLWGVWMAALLLLDFLLLRRIPLRFEPLSRLVTFLLLLPSYILFVPADGPYRLSLLTALTGQGVAFHNDAALYLIVSNLALLLIALAACVSVGDTLSRLTLRQFPRLWWCCSGVFYAVILAVTLSFLLWNVR